MAKTIKSKVEYQVTELVNNLNEAATATSEQKRDFFTTRALYNAKRLSTIVTKAKIGAMAVIAAVVMASCGSNNTAAINVSDSTAVANDSVSAQKDTNDYKAENAARLADSTKK